MTAPRCSGSPESSVVQLPAAHDHHVGGHHASRRPASMPRATTPPFFVVSVTEPNGALSSAKLDASDRAPPNARREQGRRHDAAIVREEEGTGKVRRETGLQTRKLAFGQKLRLSASQLIRALLLQSSGSRLRRKQSRAHPRRRSPRAHRIRAPPGRPGRIERATLPAQVTHGASFPVLNLGTNDAGGSGWKLPHPAAPFRAPSHVRRPWRGSSAADVPMMPPPTMRTWGSSVLVMTRPLGSRCGSCAASGQCQQREAHTGQESQARQKEQ